MKKFEELDNGKFRHYVGTKEIQAIPMNRADYNDWRGWTLPEDENGEDEGYLVEYMPSEANEPNTPRAGYVSWSPKEVFESGYSMVGKAGWLSRLKVEKEQLAERVQKLSEAISKNLVPKSEVAILLEQLQLMTMYLNLLNVRYVRALTAEHEQGN